MPRSRRVEQIVTRAESQTTPPGSDAHGFLVGIHLVAVVLVLGRLEVVIILILVVVGGVLLGRLGKVDDTAAGAAAALDDVVEVNLLEAVLLLGGCACALVLWCLLRSCARGLRLVRRRLTVLSVLRRARGSAKSLAQH